MMYRTALIIATLVVVSFVFGACTKTPATTLTTASSGSTVQNLVSKNISIYYDDGKPDNYASQGLGWGYSVLFSPPKFPFTIEKIKLFIRISDDTSSDEKALIEIWNDNLDTIYTHEFSSTEFNHEGSWIEVAPNIKVSKEFRVVFYAKITKSDKVFSGIWIGFDSNSENKHSEVVRNGGHLSDWPAEMEKTKPRATTQWMIRVTGSYMATPD